MGLDVECALADLAERGVVNDSNEADWRTFMEAELALQKCRDGDGANPILLPRLVPRFAASGPSEEEPEPDCDAYQVRACELAWSLLERDAKAGLSGEANLRAQEHVEANYASQGACVRRLMRQRVRDCGWYTSQDLTSLMQKDASGTRTT